VPGSELGSHPDAWGAAVVAQTFLATLLAMDSSKLFTREALDESFDEAERVVRQVWESVFLPIGVPDSRIESVLKLSDAKHPGFSEFSARWMLSSDAIDLESRKYSAQLATSLAEFSARARQQRMILRNKLHEAQQHEAGLAIRLAAEARRLAIAAAIIRREGIEMTVNDLQALHRASSVLIDHLSKTSQIHEAHAPIRAGDDPEEEGVTPLERGVLRYRRHFRVGLWEVRPLAASNNVPATVPLPPGVTLEAKKQQVALAVMTLQGEIERRAKAADKPFYLAAEELAAQVTGGTLDAALQQVVGCALEASYAYAATAEWDRVIVTDEAENANAMMLKPEQVAALGWRPEDEKSRPWLFDAPRPRGVLLGGATPGAEPISLEDACITVETAAARQVPSAHHASERMTLLLSDLTFSMKQMESLVQRESVRTSHLVALENRRLQEAAALVEKARQEDVKRAEEKRQQLRNMYAQTKSQLESVRGMFQNLKDRINEMKVTQMAVAQAAEQMTSSSTSKRRASVEGESEAESVPEEGERPTRSGRGKRDRSDDAESASKRSRVTRSSN
jgi:hypothetical protein